MHGVLCRTMICLSFFLSGAVSAALALRARLAHGVSPRRVACGLFTIEVAVLVASWVIGVRYHSHIWVSGPQP